jgi:hypothetical protein
MPQTGEHHGHRGGGSQCEQGPPSAAFGLAPLVHQKLAFLLRGQVFLHCFKCGRHFHHRGRALERSERQAAVEALAETGLQRVAGLIRPWGFGLGFEVSGDLR